MKNEICLIIPCYNSLATIERMLKSVLNQTRQIFDTYLAVDGDNLEDEYNYLANRYNCKVLYFDTNLGAGMTRQRALDKIYRKYKYVTFADSDDMLNPRAIEALYHGITTTNSDIAYSNIIRQLEDDSCYLIDVTNPSHKAISWCVGKMYKIDFLRKKKIRFREDLRLNEDLYFTFMAFNSTKNICQVPEVTYLWLYNKNSTTTKDRSKKFIAYDIYQSILSSTYAILDLAERQNNNLSVQILTTKLINIYTISQEALYHNIPLKYFKKVYNMLSEQVDVKEFVKNNIEMFHDRLPQIGYTLELEYFYYSQTFIEFIKKAYNK